MAGPGQDRARIRARRSTWAGLGGIVLVGVAVLLTVTHVGGDVLPTVLGIVGVGSLMAGVSTGTMQVVDAFRYSRPDPDGDGHDEDPPGAGPGREPSSR
jgi:hypothetical protein